MAFGEFLKALRAGEQGLYLTTQEGAEGKVVRPPVSEVRGDFPKQPELLGQLVAHQVNLWIGSSKNGASSGLHHDFHDNLYLLLR